MLVPYALAFGIARYGAGRGTGAAALQALGFGFPAIPFTGLPILAPLIGAQLVVVVAVGGIISNIILVPATLVLLAAGETGRAHAGGGTNPPPGVATIMRGALAQPVVIAPIFGLAVVTAGVPIPATILHALLLLGVTVGGVSLFASGIILAARNPALSPAVAITTTARIVAIPALMLG